MSHGVEEEPNGERFPGGLPSLIEKLEGLVTRYFEVHTVTPTGEESFRARGERYVSLRAGALSVEFFELMQELFGEERQREGREFAAHVLYELAQTIGGSDARRLHERLGLEEPLERLSAGPVHFAKAGWGVVRILEESTPMPDSSFYLRYRHECSFEADAWLAAGRSADFPVCVMNAGYSAGWCEASVGVPLVAAEVSCRARGDAHCEFVMAHPNRIGALVARLGMEGPFAGPWDAPAPDLFDRKRFEQKLRRIQEDAERRAERRIEGRMAELREAYERLRERTVEQQWAERERGRLRQLEALGRLSAAVAHDFNNVLAIMFAQLDVLAAERADDTELLESLSEVRAVGERAAEMTRRLLAFARRQPSAPRMLDVHEAVQEIAAFVGRLLGEDVSLQVVPRTPSEEPAIVYMDPAQLSQILLNLLFNARDAMPRGGQVRLAVEVVGPGGGEPVSTGRWVRLSVSDTGVGMDAETIERATDPFFTTKGGAGSGLGLSTVFGVVEQVGGHLSIASQPGEGTEVVVFLPWRKGSVVSRTDSDPSLSQLRGTETILLVEDEPALLEVLCAALRDSGYRTIPAAGLDEAFEALEGLRAPLDAIVTDAVLPGGSGCALVERALARHPSVCVVVTSGYAGSAPCRVPSGLRVPPRFVPKPFGVVDLLRALREVLDASVSRAEEA